MACYLDSLPEKLESRLFPNRGCEWEPKAGAVGVTIRPANARGVEAAPPGCRRIPRAEEMEMFEMSGGLIPTARAVIDINRPCNAKCVMCYYTYDESNWSKSYEQVAQELSAAKNRGNTSVDFTGGEPTIHPEMERVIRTAEGMGLHTCIITNGLALEKVKKLANAGCGEWLVSLHGFEGQHDRLLKVPNAWEKVNRTIDHLNDAGAFIRVNCTLTRYNARDLPRLAQHYIDRVRPRIVNFINFNPHYEWGNSEQPEVYKRLNEVQVKGSEVSPYLREAIDLLSSHNVWVNVRYFPFCLLKGHEAHICNNPQVMFDPYEWDYGVTPKTSEAYLKYGRDLQERIGSSEGRCGECGIIDVCGGIHKNYARLHGYGELIPYSEQSDYPFHFRSDLTTDIVVPAYRPNEVLQNLLREIAEKSVQPYRLIVVSAQRSAAGNRNVGLSSSSSPYVIMCDDDVCDLPMGWNRTLLQLLKENPHLLAVSARLMNKDGTIGRNTANNYSVSSPLVEVGMIPTACCIFRRSDVLFDERYVRAGWEDTDFFMQMKQRLSGGFAIANQVRVVHLNEEKNNGGAQNQQNQQLFMKKWGDPSETPTSTPTLSIVAGQGSDLPSEVLSTLEQGDFDEAFALLQKSARNNGGAADLLHALALAGCRRGESEKALRCLYQAALLGMGREDILKTFVSASRECGKFNLLEAFLRMITSQHPDLHGYSMLLADCLLRQGKQAEALQVLDLIVSRDAKYPGARELLDELDRSVRMLHVANGQEDHRGIGQLVNPGLFNNLRFMTRRGCVDVGHICDIDCRFCYHRFEDRADRLFLSKQEIMDRLKRDREEYDLVVTDFTGGEPTLHPDIVEIVAYGNQIGNRICLISHGQWRNLRRIEAVIDAGVYEFLLSIHGVKEDHDAATNPGAFDRIMQSIEFLEEKKVKYRANCVAHKGNMKRLPEYARTLVELPHRPYNVNFIVFSPLAGWHGRSEIDFQAKHSELAPHVRDALKIFNEAGIWANIRYYPMCMLPGLEQHITCFPQICYDPFEWDYRSYANPDADIIRQVYEIGRSKGLYGETPYHLFHNTWSIIQSQKIYRKGPACLSCRLRLICDGIAEQYQGRFGFDELTTQPGEFVSDPVFFRRHHPQAVGN
jgi:MoaA/NifB/PqqE/SkfB family radical SAM enzyme